MPTLNNKTRELLTSLVYKKYRDKYKRFLIEGIKPVTEALQANFPIDVVYISNQNTAAAESIASLAQKKTIPLAALSAKELKSISTLKSPEGVLAVGMLSTPQELPDPARLSQAIFLWQINDPGNLGALIRTALWFNIHHLFLSPRSVDPFNPKVVRASMGTLFRMAIYREIDFETVRQMATAARMSTTAADIHGQDLGSFDPHPTWFLILGNESHGLPSSIIKQADTIVRIPKNGYGDSLNLAVSAGIILHAFTTIKRG